MWPSPLRDRARLIQRRSLRLVARHPLIARIGRWGRALRRADAALSGQAVAQALVVPLPWQPEENGFELPAELPLLRVAEPTSFPESAPSREPSPTVALATPLTPTVMPAAPTVPTTETTAPQISAAAPTVPEVLPPALEPPAPAPTTPPATTSQEPPSQLPVPSLPTGLSAQPASPPTAARPSAMPVRPRRAIIEEMPTTGDPSAQTDASARAEPPVFPAGSATPTEQPADPQLFAPRADRSPGEWLDRLQPERRPQPPAASASSAPPAQQLPLAVPPAVAPQPRTAPTPREPGSPPPQNLGRESSGSSPAASPTLPLTPSARYPATASQVQAQPVDAGLFAPAPEQDRTPEAWLAQLRRAATPFPPPSVPQPSTDPASGMPTLLRETPSPLPEASLRFLRPLVGVDPATVRIFRGAVATEAVAAQHADALTVGEDVLLGAVSAPETPAQLGLLAHELTHVARQREPAFVPPLLAGASPPPTALPPDAPIAPTARVGEESLASRVEHQVTNLAQAWVARERGVAPPMRAVPTQVPQPGPTSVLPLQADAPPITEAQLEENESTPPNTHATSAAWGTLPAPWEPLPGWLTTTPAADRTSEAAFSAPPIAASPTAEGSPVLAAEQGRPTVSAPGAAEGAAAPMEPKSDEVDLDALARQVYAQLKRRLAAEQRRLG